MFKLQQLEYIAVQGLQQLEYIAVQGLQQLGCISGVVSGTLYITWNEQQVQNILFWLYQVGYIPGATVVTYIAEAI